jgi:methylenetetrahydrofolate reductase (NADPH)
MKQVEPVPLAAKSRLAAKIAAGEKVCSVELLPPRGWELDKLLALSADMAAAGFDAVNIPDGPRATARLSPMATAVRIAGELEGIEPVLHYVCRDRNLLGMQADLLGAYALGVRNLLCLTGDHQTFGNHPNAKNVHDVDSISMLQLCKNMRDAKIFQCGDAIKGQEPRFLLGAAANPFADPFEFRPYRLGKKARAGADFIQTQLIFNVPKFREYMRRVVDLGLHEQTYILAGVGPIKSLGGARYMATKVPGMEVDPEYIERMRQSTQGLPSLSEIKAMDDPNEAKEARRLRKEAAEAEGIGICVEIINACKEMEGVAGVHIMAIEWEEAVDGIVKAAQIGPKYDPARQTA